MTTETAPDPVVHDWSNDLEDELAEAGMEPPQAKAYARAFELGMTRVLSIMATKQELLATRQELKDEITSLRQELKDAIAELSSQMREMATKQELKDAIAELSSQMREMATKQELKDAIDGLRWDLQREIDGLRREMRFYILINFGMLGAILGVVLSKI